VPRAERLRSSQGDLLSTAHRTFRYSRWQPRPQMVRRGSTVRVRQRALQKPRKAGLLLERSLARSTASGRYGALYGAFRSRSVSLRGQKAGTLPSRGSFRRDTFARDRRSARRRSRVRVPSLPLLTKPLVRRAKRGSRRSGPAEPARTSRASGAEREPPETDGSRRSGTAHRLYRVMEGLSASDKPAIARTRRTSDRLSPVLAAALLKR
jgi:hypothetical protein